MGDIRRMMFWMGAMGFVALLFCTGGCDKFEPVAKADCSKVVKHSRKLLAARADPYSKAMASCKNASDQERGCAMVADSPADLLRCSM